MKIVIGADHAGYDYKNIIIEHLKTKGIDVTDKGTFSIESVDYPDYAKQVAQAVHDGEFPFGILICGSANGVCMTANKFPKVRAALCWSVQVAQLTKQHNDANIICIPARFVSSFLALDMIDAFLNTSFEGGRHKRRVDKICM